ncbi:uroporphyrinogen decarboxylase family protein [Desulfobacula sp.]|uniref:uroporphyrinogen decarboxylase family protein n=1 Tax=Desulfobacula sp. TaxID=2593537 RepID=UPI00260552AC|nr:uroporphyrinogen decarboxylase family protein [Desulfobacula sp.]
MIDLSKKDKLTAKERMMNLIAGKPLDRVPFIPFASGFSARVFQVDRGKFYRDPKTAFAAGMNLTKTYPWMNSSPTYGWADRGGWEFGGSILWPDNNCYPSPLSPEPVITDPGEVDTLLDPDPDTAGMMPLISQFNLINREYGFPASLPGGTPTTFSAGIAGLSNLMRWMIKYPETVLKLQRKVTDFLIRCAQKTIHAYGGENCSLFCALPVEANDLISEKSFETFCKPYVEELLIYYMSCGVRKVTVHLCGNHTRNLKYWKDMPLPKRTIFSIGHEMDLEKTGRTIGSDHILAGNISSGVLKSGSPEAVEEETCRCLSAGMKHAGGFILMPSCELPPDTPFENIDAVGRAIRKAGYY